MSDQRVHVAFAALQTAGVLSWMLGAAAGAQPAPGKAPKKAPAAASYIGTWYIRDVKTCQTARTSPEGALVYTATQMFAGESICKIEQATKRGSATELALLCRAEGETSHDKELVEVIDGKLRRAVTVDGKMTVFTCTRCP